MELQCLEAMAARRCSRIICQELLESSGLELSSIQIDGGKKLYSWAMAPIGTSISIYHVWTRLCPLSRRSDGAARAGLTLSVDAGHVAGGLNVRG
ncbi:hypothetical protein BDN71DRAFT_1455086 [Pleurotus eryngii]|uniref:Uncharacterized protein n=1 Tax=Pleurotus eryngii TaxID=5323 RepID=A0A9P5ZN33_PLEER|nr:hypothetical protein BDN71DRAFT_1455086 [Pleurotus eryngii]